MSAGKLKKNIFCPLSHIVEHIGKAAATVVTLSALACVIAPVHAENPDIASRRAAERHDFTNEEIQDGFFKIAFQAEFQVGPKSDRVRKFDEPVRIFIDSKAQPERSAEIATIVADIRRRIDHLEISANGPAEQRNGSIDFLKNTVLPCFISTSTWPMMK
jgi:Protein of unknown function (DUF2927)